MPFDSSPDLLVDESATSRRTSAALAVVACTALAGNCLLNSPSRFSEQQLQDTSLLRPVVWLLALGGQVPTARGVEVRNLIFYTAAALMAVLAGARLVVSKVRPRMSEDDLWDFRSRAAGPYFWWCVLLIVSVLSSWYSHAPSVCKGQTIARFLQIAWWWPLAALLAPRHARAVVASLLAVLAITAAVGVWHYLARVMPGNPDARLQYPIGNELWLAACLLPGVFIALGLLAGRPKAIWMAATVFGLFALLVALYLTRSRSAAAGLVAGFVFLALFLVPSRWRKPVILVVCLTGIAGTFVVQRKVSTGLRTHSIRSRIAYEWPYALHLFSQKPAAGNGDGAFGLLAGKFARDDQIDDPGIMRSDESFWTGHAHNEFLELLADLGVIGAMAFAAAIAITLHHAYRSAATSSTPGEPTRHRWLIIGLSAALAASTIEACGTPAIREPGAPPIFLTVWACLWALIRRSRPAPQRNEKDKPISVIALRLVGLVVALGACALGWQGIQDWRAARGRFEAEEALYHKNYAISAQKADFAAAHLLDPFQKNLARMIAVWARSLQLDQVLAGAATTPTDSDLEIAREAFARLNQLKQDAPRFLRVSRLESELALNCSRAFERRGDRANFGEFQTMFVAALERSRADEPFLSALVVALWKAKPAASAMERLNWLRSLIRVGEMDGLFLQLFGQLDRVPGFAQVLEGLYQIASRDEARPPAQWEDRLSPETLRLAALAKALSGYSLDAAKLADRAAALYEKAGPRLFAGHAAALHESVRYRFAADPIAIIDENLDRLARAWTLLYSPITRDVPLRGALGETRLHLLLAAGHEREAEAQIALLNTDPGAPEWPMPGRLAKAYANLAALFAENPGRQGRLDAASRYDAVKRWCVRATELGPTLPDPYAVLLRAALRSGDDLVAKSAAQQILKLEPDRTVAIDYLSSLRERYPDRSFWLELERQYPELHMPPTTGPASRNP